MSMIGAVFQPPVPQLSIVYLLTNPAMPGLVKIGMTAQDDAQARLDQLYTTGVPVPFELVFACRVANPAEVERALHTAFGPQRINARREFFRIEPEQALAILRLLHVEDVTREVDAQPSTISVQEQEATKAVRKRRPNFDFEQLGIPIGSELQCTKTEDVVIVSGPRRVRFQDEELSLTAVTQTVLQVEYAVGPGNFWTFNGKTIRSIYEESFED